MSLSMPCDNTHRGRRSDEDETNDLHWLKREEHRAGVNVSFLFPTPYVVFLKEKKIV